MLFYALSNGTALTHLQLNDYLVQILPAYAFLPDEYLTVEKFSFLPGGKVDLQALEKRYDRTRVAHLHKEYDQCEQAVLNIIKTLLKIISSCWVGILWTPCVL